MPEPTLHFGSLAEPGGDLFALVSLVFSPNVLLGFGGIEKFRLDPAVAETANRKRC